MSLTESQRAVQRELTVIGLGDSRILEGDVVNGVVRTTADTANGKTVATGAVTAAEGDVLSRR